MSEDLSKRPKKDEEDDDDDEDDDFDEEGNAEEEESDGWVDEKPPTKETLEDEDKDANNKKVESVVKNNTDSEAPPPSSSSSSSSSSSLLTPAKALPDRLMPKQVGSVDEAVKTLLRPNSRPGSRLLVTVEFDQLNIDPEEVRKKLQEEREKLARNKHGEGSSEQEGEAVEYTATELFQKLQALRPQDNKEGAADAGVVPPLNVANVGESNKVESPRPVSPRAAELADMIEKAVER